jgi:hypothetical protein
VVRECAEWDEIFVAGEGCVLGDRSTCEVFVPAPTVPTFPTDPTDPTLPIDRICDGVQLGFKPNPEDCTSFILCIAEIPEVIPCPPSTPVYNPATETCAAGDYFILDIVKFLLIFLYLPRKSRDLRNFR